MNVGFQYGFKTYFVNLDFQKHSNVYNVTKEFEKKSLHDECASHIVRNTIVSSTVIIVTMR